MAYLPNFIVSTLRQWWLLWLLSGLGFIPVVSRAQSIWDTFQYGHQLGLAAARQEGLLRASFHQWTAGEQRYVQQQIGRWHIVLSQFMLLESLMAGDQATGHQSFASQINQLIDAQLLERCSVRTSLHGLIQQWQNSCSITVVEVFLADLCPRYVCELKAAPDYSTVDTALPDGIAQQQQLVRQYSGQCSPRGIVNGGDTSLNGPLNDLVGKSLTVNCGAQAVSDDPDESFRTIRAQLAAGLCVPIRINSSPGFGHFLLILANRTTANDAAFLIYEPFNGMMGYLLETTFKQGHLAPVNTSWHYQLTHVYIG